MTKIVNPFAFRLGVIRDWRSNWITKRGNKQAFIKNLQGDV